MSISQAWQICHVGDAYQAAILAAFVRLEVDGSLQFEQSPKETIGKSCFIYRFMLFLFNVGV